MKILAFFTGWVLVLYIVVFFSAMYGRDKGEFFQNPWPLMILFLILSIPTAMAIIEIGRASTHERNR